MTERVRRAVAMSALGQKQTFSHLRPMSALPPTWVEQVGMSALCQKRTFAIPAKGCLNDGRRLRDSAERYSHSECPAKHLMGRAAGVGLCEPPAATPRDQDRDPW